MVKIEVLSTPGCSNCARVEEMLDELKVKYTIINIIEHPEILQKYMVMTAPGIVIDGKLEFTGVPSEKELKEKLKIK